MPREIVEALESAAAVDRSSRNPDTPRIQSDKRAGIQALLWALKPLLNLRGSRSIPLPFAIAFLIVALDEGKGNNEYARMIGIERRKMTRYFRDIGPRSRNGGAGLGLIAIKPLPGTGPQQRTRIVLTPKGRAIADQMFREWRRLPNWLGS